MKYNISPNCGPLDLNKIEFKYYVGKETEYVYGFFNGKWYCKNKRDKTINLVKDNKNWSPVLNQLNSMIFQKTSSDKTSNNRINNIDSKNNNLKQISMNKQESKHRNEYPKIYFYGNIIIKTIIVIGVVGILHTLINRYYYNGTDDSTLLYENNDSQKDFNNGASNSNQWNEDFSFEEEYRTPHEIEVENSFFKDTIYHEQIENTKVGNDFLGKLLKTALSVGTDPEIQKERKREFDRRPKFSTINCTWCPGQFTVNKYDYPNVNDIPDFCSRKCKEEWEISEWRKENFQN